jgi:AbrB family looped-hinge helix DNA binding protein
MSTTLVMDKAGRVVIPKPLRKELHLEPGDTLELETHGDQITLKPIREKARMVKEQGVWVFYSGSKEPITVEMVNGMIDEDRLERERRFLCEGD